MTCTLAPPHKKDKYVQCILTNANVKKFRATSARFILERETRKKRQKKNAHYLSANVFSKKVLCEDTVGPPFYMII